MQDEARRAERLRLQAELEELTATEAECLCRAVDLVQNKASGAAIRSIYSEVEMARSRKNRVLRELEKLSPQPSEAGMPPPGSRSGAGAAEAWPHLQNDERRRGRLDVGH